MSNTTATQINGLQGNTGAQGDGGGLRYFFDSTTSAGVSTNGSLRFNNGTIGSVTNLYINILDVLGNNFASFIAQWAASSSAVKGYIVIKENLNSGTPFAVFSMTAVTNNSTYYTVVVTYISGTIPVNGDQIVVEWIRTGDSGAATFNVNGGSVSNPNLNAATPAAPTNDTNVAFQVSGSNISGYVPTCIPRPFASGRWWSRWFVNGTAALVPDGDTPTFVGSTGVAADATFLGEYFFNNSNGALNNVISGISAARWPTGKNLNFIMYGGLGAFAADDQNIRLWVGLSNDTAANTMNGSATPNSKFAAFRFDTSVPDTHFICCVSNGGGVLTTHDSGVTPSFGDGHQHFFQIVFNDTTGTVYFFIDGNEVSGGGLTTNLPTSATMVAFYQARALTASSKQWRVYQLYLERDN